MRLLSPWRVKEATEYLRYRRRIDPAVSNVDAGAKRHVTDGRTSAAR
jgi:hypothetical protein